MSQNEPTRLDRLEALAETTLLAIRELYKQQRFDDIARQQALNAEQISANQAGMVELRNLFADFVRNQNR